MPHSPTTSRSSVSSQSPTTLRSPTLNRSPNSTRTGRPAPLPRTSRSNLLHSRRQSYSSSFRSTRRSTNLSDRAATLVARLWTRANKLRRKAESWFWSLTPLQKAGVVILCIFSAISSILSLVYHEEIFHFLTTMAKSWRNIPAGWLILLMITVVVSFPPLIGYSTAVMLGGFVFGVPNGWYIVATGSTIGATISFTICRHLLSGFVTRLTARDPNFAALALTLKHDGFKLLVMIRLCPLPFSLTNGALSSIPTVSPLKFFLATAIASPKLFIHVWIGQQMAILAESGDKIDAKTRTVSYIGIAIGSIVGGVTGWWIWMQTKKRAAELQEIEAQREAEEGGELPDPHSFEEEDDDDVPDLGGDGGDMEAAIQLLRQREDDINEIEMEGYDEDTGSYHDETEGSNDDGIVGNGKTVYKGDLLAK